MDEDAKHFLYMLDAATERVFEAYTGKMAVESCTVAVPQSEQVLQNSPSLLQGKELGSQFSFRNASPFHSESVGTFNEQQNRRKRCRTSVDTSFPGLVVNQINFGLNDNNSSLLLPNINNHFVSWPQNFTFQSHGVNRSVGGPELKQSTFLIKNQGQLPKTSHSRIQRSVSDLERSNVGIEKKEVEKPVDFSKEIEDAINRIESLIPSLQKLVNSAHSPQQESVAKWSKNINCADDDYMLKQSANADIEWSNLNKTQRTADKSPNVNARKNQAPWTKVKAGIGRSDSLKGIPSSNASFVSQNPVHVQGSRIMPHESSCEGAIEKDVSLRPCTRVPSIGYSNFTRHNRTSNQIVPRDLANRNTTIRKNVNEASHSKVVSDDRTSEETSWSSCASSSATTPESGSPYTSSGAYKSSGSEYYDSDESEPRHETVASDASASGSDDTYTDTDTATSSYNSRGESSYVGPSSQMSSVRHHKWDPQKERGKRRGGRLRRLRKKLGMIFHHHHHHHHHHHYSDKDEPDSRHARSLWTRLGGMFRHSKNDDDHHYQKTNKAEKPRKSEIKTVVKRKQQGGHFHALVDGLMKHMKHSKKPKEVKTGIKGLGNARNGGKNLPWLPKIRRRRGGVKVSNKGKVKLGNYRTKSMAAAKLILGK